MIKQDENGILLNPKCCKKCGFKIRTIRQLGFQHLEEYLCVRCK